MTVRLPLVASLAALLSIFPACSSRGTTETAAPASGIKQPVPTRTVAPVEGSIAALIEREGVLTAECTLSGSLEVGSLLRVYGEVGGQPVFKGMLQVSEGIDQRRVIAQAIGVTDRSAAFTVGDRVRLADLGAAYADFRKDLAETSAGAVASDQADQAAYAKLRQQYQDELARSAEAFARQREADLALHQAEIAEIQAAHAGAIERLRAELVAEQVAVKAAMGADVAKAIEAERQRLADRLIALNQENAVLVANAERLGKELALAHQAAIDQQVALTKVRERHQAEILAEVETREMLAQRLRAAETSVGAAVAVPVLSLDPRRGETVLTTLDRTARELEQARGRIVVLEADLAEAQETAARQAKDLADSRERIAALESAERQAGGATRRALDLETELEAARAKVKAHELARLEAERQLYDIAAHLLAAEDAATIDELQARLRTLVAKMTAGDTP